MNQVGRFEIVRELGSGSQGRLYVGRDEDGSEVAIKELAFGTAESWKAIELFERETETLRSLDHGAIPAFIDAIQTDDGFFLVQRLVPGTPLDALIATGPLSPDEVRRCALDVLEVLEYLHGLIPPVIHRDIKPANIIRRPDGSHALVDFGGVQTVAPSDVGGSTVIGTTGYMPTEQLIGRATVQSDLYSLGATLAHLATGVHPGDLPTKRLKLVWRDLAVTLVASLGDTIENMLEPVPEDRPRSARSARDAIVSDGRQTGLVPSSAPKSKPERALARVAPTDMVLAPHGDPPWRVIQRFVVGRTGLSVDLAPKLGPIDAMVAAGCAIVGLLLTIVLGTKVALFGGIAAALFFVFPTALSGGARLRLHRSGDFELSLPRVRPVRGKLLRATHEELSVYLWPEGEDRILLSDGLDDAEMAWVCWGIQRYLSDEVLPSELQQ